jgi:hypothetical protein
MGVPQTEAGIRDYFFNEVIHRQIGGPANDFEAVLKALQIAGMKVNPALGERATASWPYNGISLMVGDAGAGKARGRIFVSTDRPHNGYYLREIQVIANADGSGPVLDQKGFTWAWIYISGGPYVPVSAPAEPTEPSGDLAALTARVAALEAGAMMYGDKMGFKAENGQYLSADAEHGLGPWEKVVAEKVG